MNSQLFKNKYFIAGLGVLVAGIFLFLVFGGSKKVAPEGELQVGFAFSDPVEEILGRQILVSLSRLKNIKLDTTFLGTPVFQSFQDFTVIIPKQNVGRRDPFAVSDKIPSSTQTNNKTSR